MRTASRSCAIAAALVLSAPAPRAAERPAAPAADEADAIAHLRFAWPAPLRARVAYRKTRVGADGARSAFTTRYEMRVEPEGEGLRITTRGTSWRGDLPFPRALERDAIRAAESVVQRVGDEGEFAALEGVEAMRPVLARVFEGAKVPPQAAERAVPLALSAMRAEAEELWNLEVGFWIGAELLVGETYALASEAEIPLLPGVRAGQQVEFGVRRRVPCAAGERARRCVEATIRSAADRAALERAADALLARLLPPGEEPPEDAAKDLSAESELLLVADPATLLPRRVVWTKALRLGGGDRGAPRAEIVDRSEWDYRYLPPEPPRRPQRRPKRPPPPAAPPPAAAPAAADPG